MLAKAPFTLPADFLGQFGYPGGRRLVGLYWAPAGDESCYDDGQDSACGMTDNWLFLGFVRRPDVADWLSDHGLRLGDSEAEAEHWLVVDAVSGEVHAGHWRDARRVVIRQDVSG